MLVFENKGEMDIRGVTLFGTSVKKSSTAIGFFGTGLKYAIAVLLREGLDVVIYSGSRKHTFGLKDIDMRGKEFKQVVMTTEHKDGRSEETELAFTTEQGKTWQLWQAYRELYCNTIDESGTVELVDKKPRGRAGFTRIVVEGLDTVHAESGSFILRTEPLWELSQVDVHPVGADGKGAIFYRGVRVMEPSKRMLYSYNLKNFQELTEDRTLKYWWAANYAIMRSVISSPHAEPITEIVCAGENTFESELNFKDLEGENPGEVFLAAMGTLGKSKASVSSYGYYSGYCIENLDNLPRMALSEGQKTLLQEAKALCYPMGFEEIYAVVVTDMLGENEMSNAKNNTIYLNQKVFGQDVPAIAEVIFDNYVHLKHDAKGRSWLVQELMKRCNPEFFEKVEEELEEVA